MHHPWREFRHHAEWDLAFADLPDDDGFTCFETQTVTLDRGLDQAGRRCTIAHEVEHIKRGPTPLDSVLCAREEADIEQFVARILIPLDALGEALAWSRHPVVVADELWVDEKTLTTRLHHLHPSERAYLHRRLEDQ